ncbi:RNA polymerase II-associated [Leucosporidium creatinivorum]|uniref:RNA polymerase II-associated n=1 Tax=Leucosporidium creatinivorum TaxID=106004 RepID=A0A1Y2ER95_9BASI|nr:RNA polymerase II-associated [Leucosporidium creatinivorum]
MSSGRQQKADLLVKVRYKQNLPPPPFPPRLLHIPTHPSRYSTYEFLNPLSSERELPMIVDGELGMPLELGKIAPGSYGDGSYWTGSRTGIAPPLGSGPPVHEDDLDLLGETGGSTSATTSLPSTPGGSSSVMGDRKKVDVSWLRRTEYLSSEGGNKPAPAGLGTIKKEAKAEALAPASRADLISQSFITAHSPLADLRHPSKPHLRAESSWDVLPDSLLWANQLNLVRFGEDPGENKVGAHGRVGADPRLPRAIFRPVEIPDEEGRIGYFLPQDDETAAQYERRREQGEEGIIEGEMFDFKHVRDYEIATSRHLHQEYIFCFEDGQDDEALAAAAADAAGAEKPPVAKRPRGAYFSRLDQAQTLRKRRPRRGEDPTVFPDTVAEGTVFWDGIAVQIRGLDAMPEYDLNERQQEQDKVDKPPAAIEESPEAPAVETAVEPKESQ